jgi:hypothetical protein
VDTAALNNIFLTDATSFDERCLEVFRFQYIHNPVYADWCAAVGAKAEAVDRVEQVPFLPIGFFKSHRVATTTVEPSLVFESSGTTGTTSSRHYLADPILYRRSFLTAFLQFYGNPSDYCILALLPSYLERGNSSLVYMVDELMRESGHPQNGFFLHQHEELAERLRQLEQAGQKIILFGVTYALLDFAEANPMPLRHTIIIETGGMKGRKKEMTRPEVHQLLRDGFNLPAIHSEYSMTELLSQAYATKDGVFECPPWMKLLVRGEDDPFDIRRQGRGVANIIDLANVYSCAFIATDDAVMVHSDGHFEVIGRVDNSDIRGCSLLAV